MIPLRIHNILIHVLIQSESTCESIIILWIHVWIHYESIMNPCVSRGANGNEYLENWWKEYGILAARMSTGTTGEANKVVHAVRMSTAKNRPNKKGLSRYEWVPQELMKRLRDPRGTNEYRKNWWKE